MKKPVNSGVPETALVALEIQVQRAAVSPANANPAVAPPPYLHWGVSATGSDTLMDTQLPGCVFYRRCPGAT